MARNYSGLREQRVDTETFTELGGDSTAISEGFQKKCLAQADRSFSQGIDCQQMNSITTLMSFQDSAFIMHAPIGCASCCSLASDGFLVIQRQQGIQELSMAHYFVTNLDERDIILGGEQKLKDAVRLAYERYKPAMIFVFTSCASGIIGDNIEAILGELQSELSSRLVPVHCEGFRSKINASGFDAALLAIRDYVLKDIHPGERVPNLLNLFIPPSTSYYDQVEIGRILKGIGIEANIFPFYSNYEKIRRLPYAAASTALCKVFADEFMKELEDVYGIPYSHTIMPIGTHNTDRWLLGIAKLFNKTAEAEAYLAGEHKKYDPMIAEIRSRLAGKRVFICGGSGRSLAGAALVHDLGMELVGLETPVYDESVQIDIELLQKMHNAFVIDVANMQPFEQVNLLYKLKPDVFIGQPYWAAKMGFPTTHVLDTKRPTMGYNNLVYLGYKMLSQFENPGYNKRLAAHSSLPFKESWYQDNPFKFIKDI